MQAPGTRWVYASRSDGCPLRERRCILSSTCRPISDYPIIGNTENAALISSHGSIDWCCVPHVDSVASFLGLLDTSKAGTAPFSRMILVQGHAPLSAADEHPGN